MQALEIKRSGGFLDILEREGESLFAGAPRDVRLAALAAVIVFVAALYELMPTVAVLVAIAIASVAVAVIVNRD